MKATTKCFYLRLATLLCGMIGAATCLSAVMGASGVREILFLGLPLFALAWEANCRAERIENRINRMRVLKTMRTTDCDMRIA